MPHTVWRHLRQWTHVALLCALLATPAARAQEKAPSEADLRAGRNLLPTRTYSHEEDKATLALFDGLRVTDVMDGMDQAGLQNIGAWTRRSVRCGGISPTSSTVRWVLP